jgi:hypothetical protein
MSRAVAFRGGRQSLLVVIFMAAGVPSASISASAFASTPAAIPSTSTSLPLPTLGPIEVAVNWTTSHCTCAESPGCTDPNDPDYPDTPPRAFTSADGVAHLFATDAESRASLLRPGETEWVHNCTVFAPSQFDCSTSGYNYQTWLHSPYVLPNGLDVVAFVHMEYHGWSCSNVSLCNISTAGDCANEAIQAWRSPDGGWSWEPAGPGGAGAPGNLVVVSPYTYEYARDNFNRSELGFGDPSTIFQGKYGADVGYYFVYVSASNPDIGLNGYHGLQQRGQCLMRTNDLLDMAGSWRAWNGDSFSVTFADPYTAPIANISDHVCTPVNASFIIVNVGWSSFFNAYLASGFGSFTYPNGTHIPCCGAWLYSVTTDLLNWPPPQILREAKQEGPGVEDWEYDPVFLDPTTFAATGSRNWHEGVGGSSAFLYYWQANGADGRNVMRQTISWE